MELMDMLTIAVAILVMAIMILGFMYWYMSYKEKIRKTNDDKDKNSKKETKKKSEAYTKLSVFDFMQFDKIEDNMIVQNDGERFLMVVECEGINYDLMSKVEKTAVESGFVQFLNTLRHPVQIYTQTRTVNISESLSNYREKLGENIQNLKNKQLQYNDLLRKESTTDKQLDDLKREIIRLRNLCEYGEDVISNIEKVSQNRNVLRKSYYIIIPYYKAEIGTDLLNEEEIKNMIFSELYTRAQAIIRTLFSCSMKCRILNSDELLELLYVAYNRDDSEIFGIDKAAQAGYDELYSTAPDVLDKRMKELDEQIEEKATELARQAISEVKTEKQRKLKKKEKSFEELVKEMAQELLKENRRMLGEENVSEAIEKIKNDEVNKENTKEGGNAKNEQKTKKRTKKQ